MKMSEIIVIIVIAIFAYLCGYKLAQYLKIIIDMG